MLRFSDYESREYARHVSRVWHNVVFGRAQLVHEIDLLFDLDMVTFLAHPELLQDLQQLQQRLRSTPYGYKVPGAYMEILKAWDKEARS